MAELTGTAKLIHTAFQPTPGDKLHPVRHLLGALDAKTVSEMNEQAKGVFGTPWTELSDDEKTTDLTKSEFLTWHSAKQTAYVAWLVEKTGSTGEHVIGTGTDTIHVVLSADGEDFYILEHLQKPDIVKMPIEDQQLIAATSTWLTTISVVLDMVPTGTNGTIAAARDVLLKSQSDVSVYILEQMLESAPDDFDTEPFEMQLELLTGQLNSQAIFSATQVKEELSALQERIVRALSFYEAVYGEDAHNTLPSKSKFGVHYDESSTFTPGQDIPGYVFYRNSNGLFLLMDGDDYYKSDMGDDTRDAFSDLKGNMEDLLAADEDLLWSGFITTDYNAKLKEGYEAFIEQERIKATARKQSWDLSQTGTLNGVRLDAPTMIAYIHLLYNTQAKAMVAMNTCWIDQVQDVMKMVSAFQDMINSTSEMGNNEKPNDKYTFMRLGVRSLGDLTDEQVMAVAVFDQLLRGDAKHPVLELINLSLPDFSLIEKHDKPTFETIDVDNDGTKRELTKVTSTPEWNLENLGLEDLRDNDYVTKVSHAPWNWLEQTKSNWDSIANRLGVLQQNITKALELVQSETSQLTRKETKSLEGTSSYLQQANHVVQGTSKLS